MRSPVKVRSRTHVPHHPGSYRPYLEILEERLQPGSLLTQDLGWSLLGQGLSALDPAPPAPGHVRTAAHAALPRPARESTPFVPERRHPDSGHASNLAVASAPPAQPGTAAQDAGTMGTPWWGSRPPAGDCGDGTWSTLASMPSKRQEISTAVLNGEIYVIAGFDSFGNSTDTVEVYDSASDGWRSAAPLPIATNHNAAAVAAETLYAFGGTSNRVFAYDPVQDSWSDVAPMNYMHGNTPAVAVIDDHIYVAGGTGAGMRGNEVEVYSPFDNTWTVLSPMNVPRNHTGGGAIDGKFYVVGGRDGPGAGSALEVYDPGSDTWNMLAPLPTARSGLGAGVVNGCLYTFGGELPRLFGNVEVYNPATDTWQQLPDMPTPRHGLFASVIGNAVYLPGGATQQGLGATDVNEVFVVA